MLLGQQINAKETEIGTWNWMSDWNVHKKPKMCGNVEVAAISLDREAWLKEGGFQHKELLSRVPEKDKMLADRLFWNPREADKILEILVSEDLSLVQTVPLNPYSLPLSKALDTLCNLQEGKRERQERHIDTGLMAGGQPPGPFLMLKQLLILCPFLYAFSPHKEELLI